MEDNEVGGDARAVVICGRDKDAVLNERTQVVQRVLTADSRDLNADPLLDEVRRRPHRDLERVGFDMAPCRPHEVS